MKPRIKCRCCGDLFSREHLEEIFCRVCQWHAASSMRDHGAPKWGAIRRASRREHEEARQGISKAAHAAEITGGGAVYPRPDYNGPEWA